MKRTYLVKKNPMLAGEDNWIIMNSFEFMQFMNTEEGKRRARNFGKVRACGTNEDVLIVECGENIAKEWRIEDDRQDYVAHVNFETGISLVSLDAIDEEESKIGDEKTGGDDALDNLIIQKDLKGTLKAAFNRLNAREQEVIMRIYLADSPDTECSLAEEMGVSRRTVYEIKRKALRKLKWYLS